MRSWGRGIESRIASGGQEEGGRVCKEDWANDRGGKADKAFSAFKAGR